MAVIPTVASAAVVVSDDFTDLDRDNDGVTDDGSSIPVVAPVGFQWFAVNGLTGTGAQKPRLTTGLDGTNPGLFSESRGSNGEFIGLLGQTITVGAAVGDSVSLSFDFRYQTDPTNSTFRFGLFQDTDNQLGTGGWGTADGDFDAESPGALGDRSVWARLSSGPTASATDSRVVTETNADTMLGGSDGVDSFGSGFTFTVINDTDFHNVVLTVTRTATGVNYAFEVDDNGLVISGNAQNATTGDLVVDSFDYLAISSSIDIDFIVDNVVVDNSTIPEPATIGLMAAGFLALLRRRRLSRFS